MSFIPPTSPTATLLGQAKVLKTRAAGNQANTLAWSIFRPNSAGEPLQTNFTPSV